MRLFYYSGKDSRVRVSNFGDELNPWLWHRLIPEVFNGKNETLFVGIGTLLNDRLPPKPRKIVFGSGVGYGNTPAVDDTWKIYFVRGQLSAKALGLKLEMGITDPAILVRKFYTPSGQKRYQKSYMPHFSEVIHNPSGWQALCQSLGMHYIDPTAAVEQVLSEIGDSEILFTEAMHGAIVADALRTPWIAVKTKIGILDFKWNDWLSSLGLVYEPYQIKRFASIIGKDSLLRSCDYQWIRAQMAVMIRTAKPLLSDLARCEQLEEQVILQLEDLRIDFAKGLLE